MHSPPHDISEFRCHFDGGYRNGHTSCGASISFRSGGHWHLAVDDAFYLGKGGSNNVGEASGCLLSFSLLSEWIISGSWSPLPVFPSPPSALSSSLSSSSSWVLALLSNS